MFKKSKLLAAAIGAAAAVLCSTGAYAVDAKGSVYGDIRYGLDFSDSSGPVSLGNDVGGDTDMRELNSHIGIKASGGVGSVSVFGVYESYIDQNLQSFLQVEGSRQVFAGVNTPAGTIAYGKMFTEYAKAGLAIDPFYNTSLASGFGGVAGSAVLLPGLGAPTYNSYGLAPQFVGETPFINGVLNAGVQANQLTYTTPSFGGVTVNGGVFFDEADDSSTNGQESHDYALGAAFGLFGVKAGVQWLQMNDEVGQGQFIGAGGTAGNGTGDATATRVHAAYGGGNFGVGASWERIDLQGAGVTDEDYLFVSGWFGVAQGTRLAASYGMVNEAVDPINGASAEGTGIQFGVFHDVIENFTVNAGASWYDLADNDVSGTNNADDTYIVSLGASYKFDLGFSNTK